MAVSLEQLTRTENLIGVYSRIKTPGTMLQDFYDVGPTSGRATPFPTRYLGWDLFDTTRQRATASGPALPPTKITRKKIGRVNATALRSHESIPLLYEEIFRTKPLGQGYLGAKLDQYGESYVTRQIGFMKQRQVNLVEYAVSRLFRGGFAIDISDNDYHQVVAKDTAGSQNVNFQIPAENQSRLDMGTGSNIVDASWTLEGTDVIGQILAINAAFVRQHGMELKHIWVTSSGYGYLLNNTDLQQIGGQAFRVFDTFRENPTTPDKASSGYTVVFRALPQVEFHIYDQVLEEGDLDLTTVAGTSKIVPDDSAIFTPNPGEWLIPAKAQEVVQERIDAAPRMSDGFDMWRTPTIDPVGIDIKTLFNWLPMLPIPSAFAFSDVFF